MSFTPPPTQPDMPPDAPVRLGTEERFIEKANALVAWYAPFVSWLRSFVSWVGTFQSEASALQSDVAIKAGTTTSAAAAAAASADAAAISAAASAAAAANTGAAPAFVAGTNYAKGAVVFSALNMHTYRARTAGVRNLDPAQDSPNWLDLQPSSAKAFYLANL